MTLKIPIRFATIGLVDVVIELNKFTGCGRAQHEKHCGPQRCRNADVPISEINGAGTAPSLLPARLTAA